MQQLAQNPDLGQFTVIGDELFLAGARPIDVDRREHPLLGDAPVEMDFAVARAFEFLVDHVVHLGTRVYQGRGQDRQTAAFLDVARCAEEALGPLQRIGVHTTGQHFARRRNDRVVSTGQAGNRIEEDDDILLVFDQTLRLLDDHFGHLNVPRRGLIECARDNLALHRPLHLRDFLRPLVDEQHDQDDFGMVGGNGRCNVLQQHRLAGLGRGDDQATLTLADGRDQVDGACGQVFGGAVAALQLQALGRMERRQVLEQHLVTRAVRGVVVDLADLEQREVPLAVLRRADQAGNGVAGAQIEAPDLAGTDVDIVRTRQVRTVGGTQEPESVLQDLQDAVAVDILAVAGMRLQDREDDVLLARPGQVLQPHGLGELDQLVDRPGLQLGEIHRAARLGQLGWTDDLRVVGVERLRLVHHLVGTSPAVAVAVTVVIAAAIAVTIAVARALVGPIATLIA